MELFDSSEARKNVENVLDEDTLRALYALSDEGHVDLFYGFVKDGKESKVAAAERDGAMLAVKIYVVEASNYRDMEQYLRGDPRFEGVGSDRRSIIDAWCRKEFRNLAAVRELGIPAPEPVAAEGNVLVMEFLGQDYHPAPRLQDVDLENPEVALDRVVGYMETMWREGELVHGDLSAFNVLLWQEQLHLIDLSQAVLRAHPRADAFLERDVTNVCDHFARRYDLDPDPAEIEDRIRGGE